MPITDVGAEWMSRPLDVAIGPDGVALYREPFRGTRGDVERRLIELVQSHCPARSGNFAPPDDAERELLNALQEIVPVDVHADGRAVYVLSTPMPAVALTLRSEDASGPDRLIGHALAMPAGEAQWTLFVLPRERRNATALRIPPSMSLLLSWSDPHGNAVCAVRGAGPLSQAADDFDQLYGRDRAVIRNISADAVTLRYETVRHVVDVRLQRDEPRGWHGVVWTSPRANHK
jgi:hypothetical protein